MLQVNSTRKWKISIRFELQGCNIYCLFYFVLFWPLSTQSKGWVHQIPLKSPLWMNTTFGDLVLLSYSLGYKAFCPLSFLRVTNINSGARQLGMCKYPEDKHCFWYFNTLQSLAFLLILTLFSNKLRTVCKRKGEERRGEKKKGRRKEERKGEMSILTCKPAIKELIQ